MRIHKFSLSFPLLVNQIFQQVTFVTRSTVNSSNHTMFDPFLRNIVLKKLKEKKIIIIY